MPSLLAEEQQQQHQIHHIPRTGSPLGLRRPSVEQAQPHKPNGIFVDGNNGARHLKSNGASMAGIAGLHSLPNGNGRPSTERQTPSRNGSLVSMATNRSAKIENGAGSVEDGKGSRDDGYFARAEGAAVSQGLLSTHVALGQPTNTTLERVADEMQFDGQVLSNNSLSKDNKLPNGEGAPCLPDAKDRRSSADASVLRVPASSHRVSSPPVFQRDTALLPSGSSSTVASQAVPPRLQHRHTLEVPKVSTARTSKEIVSTSDDAMATGRFSPATPTRRRGSISLVRRGTRSIHSDMHLDEVPQDDEAARWAEHIRQKRASKRKRKEDDDDDRVVVGTKVDQNHVNWVTAYNMLTGIRFTVSRTHAKMDRDLTDQDFHAKHKFSFDITGNELTPSAKYDFKFKDYAPWVFRHLRSIFKIDPADYLMSLTSKYILSELGSPGKSGSFFYFSRDYKYIIKTIHHAEHKFLRKILRDYYDHVRQNPDTLLSQFYGLHRVKIPYGRKIHFVVMNNLFPPHRDIHRTFDLKGSTIGRDFKEEDLAKNPRATMKDLNWLRRNLHLEFGPSKRSAFVEQMEKDVALLRRLKIMDYSLLVGIHDLERGNEENLRDKTLQVFQPGGESSEDSGQQNMLVRTPSKMETARKAKELRQIVKTQKPVPVGQTADKMPEDVGGERKDFYFYSDDGGFRATHEDDSPGEEIYYLGIIDCLTYYSLIKRGEHFFKGLTNTESQISAIPPERYGERFLRFISGVTKSREQVEREKAEDATIRVESIDDPNSTGIGVLPHAHHRNSVDPTDHVMEKAELQAERSRRQGAREDAVPDRVMRSARSPSAERTGGELGHILPIVEELLESSSTGGRSGDASPSPRMRPPPTPPKDERAEFRPPTPPKDDLRPDRSPPTPPKDRPVSQDKELPGLPIHAQGGGPSTSVAASVA